MQEDLGFEMITVQAAAGYDPGGQDPERQLGAGGDQQSHRKLSREGGLGCGSWHRTHQGPQALLPFPAVPKS